jgi:hypothetical protein
VNIQTVSLLLDVENPDKSEGKAQYVGRLAACDFYTLFRVPGGVIASHERGGVFVPDHIIKTVEFEGSWQ